MNLMASKMLSAGMTMQNIQFKPSELSPDLQEKMKEAWNGQMRDAGKMHGEKLEQQEKLAFHYAALDAGAKTKTDTQLLGENKDDPIYQFLDMVGSDKSTAEKMHTRILAALGLTKEDVAAMSPEELEALNEKIKELIKQQAEQDILEAQEKETQLL